MDGWVGVGARLGSALLSKSAFHILLYTVGPTIYPCRASPYSAYPRWRQQRSSTPAPRTEDDLHPLELAPASIHTTTWVSLHSTNQCWRQQRSSTLFVHQLSTLSIARAVYLPLPSPPLPSPSPPPGVAEVRALPPAAFNLDAAAADAQAPPLSAYGDCTASLVSHRAAHPHAFLHNAGIPQDAGNRKRETGTKRRAGAKLKKERTSGILEGEKGSDRADIKHTYDCAHQDGDWEALQVIRTHAIAQVVGEKRTSRAMQSTMVCWTIRVGNTVSMLYKLVPPLSIKMARKLVQWLKPEDG
ncbi:hypothetical protein K438DRAFT_1789337 [Mycena galopus ATCC 62051]|nr:hypothetical protein K438DRAFT_1789337 [Mycena galopus ATCC 62051]